MASTSWQVRSRAAGALSTLVLLVPGALVCVLGFEGGGYFADATAATTLALLALLAVAALVLPPPARGGRAGLVIVGAALAGLAGWTLLSSAWSDSAMRAAVEYDRVLLYLAAFLLFALVGRTDGRAEVVVAGLALGAAAVGVAASATWLQPDRYEVGIEFSRTRLTWPTSYWNATGLLAGLGALWSLHVACAARVPLVVRALGAAATPVLAATLIFTVSRGAVFAVVLGLVVYLVCLRGSAVAGGLLAVAGPVVVAVIAAAGVDGLDVERPGAAALADADDVTRVLIICAVAALALRLVLGLLDRRLAARAASREPVGARRRLGVLAAGVAVCAVVFFAAGGAGEVSDAVDEFTSSSSIPGELTPFERLGRLENNGRIGQWEIALDHGFSPEPIHGSGAGTYAQLFARERPDITSVQDAHSLYAEVLGELGLVGAVLLLVALGGILVGLGRLAWQRGAAWAALAAAGATWAAHAALDWDWELPALTAWLFCAGGLALAPAFRWGARRPAVRTWPWRAAAVAAAVLLAFLPLDLLRSQRSVFDAVDALRAGDCRTAAAEAADASEVMRSRPEPYEVLAYCEMRAGRAATSVAAIDAAVRRDPGDWSVHYGRSLVLAAAGRDPSAAIAHAVRLNPESPLTQRVARSFQRAKGRRRSLRIRALRAPLPLPPQRLPQRRQAGS